MGISKNVIIILEQKNVFVNFGSLINILFMFLIRLENVLENTLSKNKNYENNIKLITEI